MKNKNYKVLISGSNSQLANSLIKTRKKNFEIHSLNKNELDITNCKLLTKTIKDIMPDIFINCSAYTNVELAEKNIQEVNLINHDGVNNIINSIKNYNILLVHFSTDYVFDGKKKLPYLETDLTKPLSQYGESKLKGEQEIIQNYNNYLIFRISWLYSALNDNFLKKFISFAKNKKQIFVVDDNLGRPTNAIFFSEFLWLAIQKTFSNQNYSGLYNFSDNGSFTSWFKIAKLIYSHMENQGLITPKLIPIKQKKYYSIAKRPKNSMLNLDKVHSNFNYKIKNWETNLNITLKEIFK